MKVSELTGAKLDYWVAMALGKVAEIVPQRVWGDGSGVTIVDGKPACRVGIDYFDPSTNFSHGGPIIEQQGIGLLTPEQSPCGQWHASYVHPDFSDHTGKTPLIAAMRCLVANKYGDEVPGAD